MMISLSLDDVNVDSFITRWFQKFDQTKRIVGRPSFENDSGEIIIRAQSFITKSSSADNLPLINVTWYLSKVILPRWPNRFIYLMSRYTHMKVHMGSIKKSISWSRHDVVSLALRSSSESLRSACVMITWYLYGINITGSSGCNDVMIICEWYTDLRDYFGIAIKLRAIFRQLLAAHDKAAHGTETVVLGLFLIWIIWGAFCNSWADKCLQWSWHRGRSSAMASVFLRYFSTSSEHAHSGAVQEATCTSCSPSTTLIVRNGDHW